MEIQVIAGKTTRNLSVRKGENLLKALLRNGVELSHPCQGKGKCGKCGVRISSWDGVTAQPGTERENPRGGSAQELQKVSKKLACLVKVDHPLTVHTDAKWTGKKEAAENTHNRRTSLSPMVFTITPPCKRVCVSLSLADSPAMGSQWGRLADGFHGKDRKVLRHFMEQILSEQGALFPLQEGCVTMTRAGRHFIGIEAGDATKGRVGAAILMHEGVLYGMLAHFETGRLLLADAVTDQRSISDFLLSLCEKAEVKAEKLTDVVMAAETGMLHALTGLPWKNTQDTQDVPVVLTSRVLGAKALAYPIARHAGVWIAPSVSASHGADHVMEALSAKLDPFITNAATDAFAVHPEGAVPQNVQRMLAGALGCLLDKKMRHEAKKIAKNQPSRQR